jgi:hypothetical protein
MLLERQTIEKFMFPVATVNPAIKKAARDGAVSLY